MRFVRHLPALALVAALAPAAARAQGPTAPAATADAKSAPTEAIDLGTLEALRATCLATRPVERVLFEGDAVARGQAREAFVAARRTALRRLYRVGFGAGGFRLGEYRPSSAVLAVDTTRPLHAMHGALSLAIDAGAGLALPADAETARKVEHSVRTGTARLDVYFELDDQAGAPCSGAIASGVYVVAARPAALVLRDGLGHPLARTETALADRHRSILGGYSGTPTALAGTLTAPGGVDARALQARLSPVLAAAKGCYAERLAERPSLAGTVIVGVEVDGGGKVSSVAVTLDALQDEALSACIEDAFRKTSFAGVNGLPTLFQAPIELKLVARGK